VRLDAHRASIARTPTFASIRRRTATLIHLRSRSSPSADVRPGRIPKLRTRVRFPSPAIPLRSWDRVPGVDGDREVAHGAVELPR
jgi:hypothetical protein